MKPLIFFIFFSAFCLTGFGQRISKVTINYSGKLEMYTIATDDAVINITPDGNIISYGVEYFSERVREFSRLENYGGRIDMYTPMDNKAFQGKLKYLGKTPVTYFASYDPETLVGKVKSIGTLLFDYYMQYDDKDIKGKIKSIGSTTISYFTSFDNEALRGKLKSLGITNLSYYTSFDDKAFSGKLKSIGQIPFTYYSSFERGYAGGMKKGYPFQIVNNVLYYLR